ncbi:hypothetical protein [Ornithinibacillus halophilus]|uniref:BshB3 potential contributor to bacillithiol synthesis n=1 Tax=Ornithinibacillus halophilus TaxID=930117 RepID=A0A1M5P096_9BACI|nr:hypothetical protein [Ornithinibacillus halophilus]SHG95220.1 hypothetical protein SAMN05216225_10966 [Ornithinibacillus halophilus]
MKFLISAVLVIGVIGLIMTLLAAKDSNADYSKKKSVSSLSLIYIIFFPILIIGGIITWIFLV